MGNQKNNVIVRKENQKNNIVIQKTLNKIRQELKKVQRYDLYFEQMNKEPRGEYVKFCDVYDMILTMIKGYLEDEANKSDDVCYYNKNGQLHKTNGPAVVHANGDKEWYQNGDLHRLDGPAVERVNGDKIWFQNDKLHREDGPAVEFANGSKSWLIKDKHHREDGPAIMLPNGDEIWCVKGKIFGRSVDGYTQEQFEEDYAKSK